MMEEDVFDATLLDGRHAEPTDRLLLYVLSPDGVQQTELRNPSQITLGRDPSCDLVLADRMTSRFHAQIIVGDEVRIQDMESANGTRVGGQNLPPGQPVRLEPGQPAEVGSTLVVVHRQRQVTSPTLRLRSHVEFEARLDQACRDRSPSGRFALIRVRVLGEAPLELVQKVLTQPLGGRDAIGAFAPGEYELLLMDAHPSKAQTLGESLESAFQAQGYGANVGLAVCPDDGDTADRLLARAGERMTEAEQAVQTPVKLSPAMRDLHEMVERVAAGHMGVLFEGETGVGKRLLAEVLHEASPRSQGPFLALNCAAFPEPVLESELFGHEPGSIQGAEQRKAGLLEQAAGGTVLLQEVTRLPPGAQGKLLQVLESSQVFAVGATQGVPVDVRFAATSQTPLESAVQAGDFRQDLYYRLAGVTLRVPSLRERPEDIVALADRFVRRFAAQMGRQAPELSPNTRQILERYPWPGNVRELKNIMERAVLLCTFGLVEPEHLPLERLSTGWTSGGAQAEAAVPTEDPEKARILQALSACGGNQTKAAAMLGVSRRTLTKWLNRYADIPRPRK